MAQARAARHAMKMGVQIARFFTRHEHGMDRTCPAQRWSPRSSRAQPHSSSEVFAMKIANHLASSALSLVLLAATAFLPASAQSGPSPQEQMACRSDAGKFCAEHIGKPPQMNACLRENKAKLSEGCRKVVESRGG